MRPLPLVLILSIVLTLLIGAVSATTYTVARDGSGNYNCDGTDDHVQINQAVATATSGDTIHIKPGTYIINGPILLKTGITYEGEGNTTILKMKDNINWPSQQAMFQQNSGTSNSNIIVRNMQIDGNAATQTYPGGDYYGYIFFIDPMSDSQFYNLYIHNTLTDIFTFGDSANCTFHDNQLYYCGHSAWYLWPGTDRCNIYNNYMYWMGNSGVRSEGSANVSVYNNSFEQMGEGIQIGTGQGTTINMHVYKNYFGYNIWHSIYSSYCTANSNIQNFTFDHNVCHDNLAYSVYVQGTNGTNIYNNIIYNTLSTYGHGDGIILTNLDYNSATHSYPSNITIKNNIVYNNAGYGITGSGTNVVTKYNDVYGNTAGNFNGISAGTGDIQQNPNFASLTNFHLLTTSPCIDTGDPTDSYSLEPAPNGNRINMGQYGNTIYADNNQVVPYASFTANITSGEIPLTVMFNDTSIGSPTTWNWNFSDGTANISTKNTTHTFSAAGTFTTTLTASNTNGSSSATTIITVNNATPQITSTTNQYPGFTVRKKLTLSSNPGVGYQVNFTIPYQTGMSSNFSDLRFDDGVHKLSYWIQPDTLVNNTSCIVWVKLAATSTTLFEHYGNSSATSESSIANTMELGDEFNSGSINSSLWTGNAVASNGYANVTGFGAIQSLTSFGRGYEVISRCKATYSGTFDGGIGFLSATDGVISDAYTSNSFVNLYSRVTSNPLSTASTAAIDQNWHNIRIAYAATSKMMIDNVDTTSATNIPTAACPVYGTSQITGTMSFDYIAVRKYSGADPAVTVGNILPVANFTATPLTGMVPLTVQFTDSATGLVQ